MSAARRPADPVTIGPGYPVSGDNQGMERLLVTTVPGFEEVAEDELRRDFGLEPELLAPGRLVADLPEGADMSATVRTLNRWSRCPDRVGILLLDCEGAADLESVREIATSLDYTELFPPRQSFAVRATRSGEQPFRSPDVARVVGTAINEVIRGRTGSPGRVDLEEPDAIVRADLDAERLLLWLDTTGYDALHVRDYRRHAHMASMRPTVANLLLRLADWRGEPLVDPFCGSATVLIEALLRRQGSAPARHRGRGWAWQRSEWLSAGDAGGAEGRPPMPSGGPATALGIERFASHLQGGWENAARAGVTDGLRLHEGLAQETDRIADRHDIDLAGGTVVTNPPFGRRVGSTGILDELYGEACRSWARAGIARVATLAERRDCMRRALEGAGYEVRRAMAVVYGSIPVTVFLAERGRG